MRRRAVLVVEYDADGGVVPGAEKWEQALDGLVIRAHVNPALVVRMGSVRVEVQDDGALVRW